jgi:putative transposase
MEALRLLPQHKILQEWWREVKENFWEKDAKKQVKELLKELMESTMMQEIVQKTAVGYYKHDKDKRDDYRNGYYDRALVTQFGLIQGIKTPRLRKGGFKTKVFRRYKRHQEIVEDLIEDIFLAGVSTRRVGEAISKLLDTKVSHGTVSNITRRLDVKVKKFHRDPIIDEYQYLLCDGITIKVRYNSKYHRRKVLVIYGITFFGERKLVAFLQAKAESQNAWEALINNVYNRGLKGENLRMIITDGSTGLRSALSIVYPYATIQRCWVHKLRNVSNYLKKIYHDDCIKGARRIYNARNKHLAIAEFKNWKRMWRKKAPRAVHCLEKDLEKMLSFFDCPKNHWVRVRTTNAIERSFKEVRRRTRVFSCFSNLQSCERIIYAIFAYLNNKWKERPIKQFTQFC